MTSVTNLAEGARSYPPAHQFNESFCYDTEFVGIMSSMIYAIIAMIN